MNNPEFGDERNEKTQAEEQRRLIRFQKYYRELFILSKVLYCIGLKRHPKLFDHDTKRVLVDERDDEDDELPTISTSAQVWVRLLGDGRVEISYETKRYDKGYETPHIAAENVPEALAQLHRQSEEKERKEAENPVEAAIESALNSDYIILGRSQKLFVLEPNSDGTHVLYSSWSESYNENGLLIDKKEGTQIPKKITDETVRGYIDIFHFNFFSEVSRVLRMAKASQWSEMYSELLTLEVKSLILEMVSRELAIKNHPSENILETEVKEPANYTPEELLSLFLLTI